MLPVGLKIEWKFGLGPLGQDEPVDRDMKEVEALIRMALAGKAAGAQDMEHLDGAAGAFNSVRMADLVASTARSEGLQSPVLDWGCGYGQISWLLRRRGLRVISCDVERRPAREFIPELRSLEIDYHDDPVKLPYRSGEFGAVISAGVLEHVRNEEGSLAEISRVLRPGGVFIIFMLPNRFSWAEWLADLRHVSVHPRKYTMGATSRLLGAHGFVIERRWRRHLLPRNLTGFSHRTKAAYGRYCNQVESIDKVLARYPPICVFSGVMEVIARKL